MPTLSFDAFAIFQLLFYLALLIFVIHAIVLSYHWLSFGANKGKSLMGIAVHLGVGSLLLIVLALSLVAM